jgi:hypothetical protein
VSELTGQVALSQSISQLKRNRSAQLSALNGWRVGWLAVLVMKRRAADVYRSLALACLAAALAGLAGLLGLVDVAQFLPVFVFLIYFI